MRNVNKSMILVGGSKGGIGKSLVSMAVVDWLYCAKSESVLLIDTDNTNTDVYKVYATELKPEPRTVDLDGREGWLVLADRCAEHPDAHVVINTGARNLAAMLLYAGSTMTGAATKLKRHVAVLWVIDEKRDCVELLRRYIDETPEAVHNASQLHVVCNEGKVEGQSFELYLESKTAQAVEKMKGKTIVVPSLAPRATTLLYDNRKTIRAVAGDDENETMPFGNQLEMNRWRGAVREGLETLELTEG